MTSLLLPSSIRPSAVWKKRGQSFWNDVRQKASWNKPEAQPREHPGKKNGLPTGGWIDDLSALRKAIILCWRCQPKFDHKRANYYKDERFPHVVGKCDGCREYMNHQTKLYIHESFLGEPGGRTKAGQSWTPL